MQHVKIMKRIRIVFLLFFVVLVSISSIKAEVHPPSPQNAQFDEGEDPNTPPPPGAFPGPIDENIVLLLIAGLVLGATVVYKNKIKKASM